MQSLIFAMATVSLPEVSSSDLHLLSDAEVAQLLWGVVSSDAIPSGMYACITCQGSA